MAENIISITGFDKHGSEIALQTDKNTVADVTVMPAIHDGNEASELAKYQMTVTFKDNTPNKIFYYNTKERADTEKNNIITAK
jgi:hypothetical protein